MAGAPPTNQPYGQQFQPMPQYAPASGRRPGSVSPKVWGIILLVLGLVGLLGWVIGLASLAGGGISGSALVPNLSPEVKTELDRMAEEMASNMKGRWSFWLNQVIEVVIIGLSLTAGLFLVIKPKPLGRKLAIARALVVMLTIPIAGYEGITAMEEQMEMQTRMQKVQVEDAIAKDEANNPSKTESERLEKRRRTERIFDDMAPLMKGLGFGVMVIMFVGILILNSLLLFFMTRPAVKEYLESVAAGGDQAIPGYDPSMGLASGPPQQPPSGQTPPV
jgi:hypothetical protein